MFLTPEFRSSLYSIANEEIGYDPRETLPPLPFEIPSDQGGETSGESSRSLPSPVKPSSPVFNTKETLVEIDDETLSTILSMGFNLEQVCLLISTLFLPPPPFFYSSRTNTLDPDGRQVLWLRGQRGQNAGILA